MSDKKWPRYVALGVFFLLGALFFRGQRPRPGAPAPSAAPSQSAPSNSGPPIAGLGGLRAGERIGEWLLDRVETNRGPGDSPQLELLFLRADGAGFSVYITPREKFATARVFTKKYGVSHGGHRPGPEVPSESEQAIFKDIIGRLEKNESSAPELPGL